MYFMSFVMAHDGDGEWVSLACVSQFLVILQICHLIDVSFCDSL